MNKKITLIGLMMNTQAGYLGYYGDKVITDKVRKKVYEWLARNRYDDRSYGIRKETKDLIIVTGLVEGDEDLLDLPIPVPISDRGRDLVVVDVRKYVTKGNVYDGTLDGVLRRTGLGVHHITLGVLILEKQFGGLGLERGEVELMVHYVSTVLGSVLNLFDNDKEILTEVLYKNYIRVAYREMDAGDRVWMYREMSGDKDTELSVLGMELEDNSLGVVEGVCNMLSAMDVSDRLKRLTVDDMISISVKAIPQNIKGDMMVAMDYPIWGVMVAKTMFETSMFKRTGMVLMLKKFDKVIKPKDLFKRIDGVMVDSQR